MTDTVTGVVDYVAVERGGINLDGRWYNATENAMCRDRVVKELRGFKVELTLEKSGSNLFTELTNLGRATSSDRPLTKDGYWDKKDARDIERSERISKAGALNTAVDLLTLAKMTGTPQELLKHAIVHAEKIRTWVEKPDEGDNE